MKKILTVKEPYIQHTPEVSTLFSIITHNPEAFKWLLMNFLSMGIDKVSILDEMVWFEDYYEKCPFIECTETSIQDLKIRKFTDFIEDSINNNIYIALPLNTKYIGNYSGNKNYLHDVAIFGYDNSINKVYIMDHFRDGKFTFEECSYSEINNGFDGLNEAENIFHYNLSIKRMCCIDNVHYEIKESELVRTLQDFIDGINLVEKYYEIKDIPSNTYDYHNICFGSSYYTALASLIAAPVQKIYLLRAIFLLTAHAKILLGICEYIFLKYGVDQIGTCSVLAEKNNKILYIFLKDLLKYKEKQKNTINLLKFELLEARELECSIMKRLVMGIVSKHET